MSVTLFSVVLASRPAAAQEIGVVTGTITAQATGQPVGGACVDAYATQTDVLDSACTAPDGTYTIGVPVGTYRIRVHDPLQRFATRWAYAADSYDAADPISVVANPATIVDVALLNAGAIVGTVTDAVTGTPIDACVEVLAVGSDDFAAYACTDGSGQYRAVLADPGDYNVHFRADAYVEEWANDRATRDVADAITVVGGQDTVVNAQLTPLGQITGRVINLAGAPLPFITVAASSSEEPYGFAYAETDFDGYYRIRGLPAGRYQVTFADGFGNWVTEWWNDSHDGAHPDLVQVALATETPNINAALGPTGYITGTVTDAATGQPVPNVWVQAVYASTGMNIQSPLAVYTGPDGRYQIQDVGGTSYKVVFQPTDPTYAQQWYRNKPTLKSANRIRVDYATTTPNIDVALQRT
jgi:5-hydroxyisourate hydrolase-like protein (transthyretin family)